MPNFTNLRTVGPVTPTIDNNSAYAALDLISDTAVITDSAGRTAASAADQLCYCTGLSIWDRDDNTAYDLRIVFLSDSTSMGTINSAPNISDANGQIILGTVLIAAADWYDFGGFKRADADLSLLPKPLIPKSGTPNVYYAIIAGTGATPTYLTAAGLRLQFWFQDIVSGIY